MGADLVTDDIIEELHGLVLLIHLSFDGEGFHIFADDEDFPHFCEIAFLLWIDGWFLMLVLLVILEIDVGGQFWVEDLGAHCWFILIGYLEHLYFFLHCFEWWIISL